MRTLAPLARGRGARGPSSQPSNTIQRASASVSASESLAPRNEPAEIALLLSKLEAAKTAAEEEASHYRAMASEESIGRRKAERKAALIEEEIAKMVEVQRGSYAAEKAWKKAERRERRESQRRGGSSLPTADSTAPPSRETLGGGVKTGRETCPDDRDGVALSVYNQPTQPTQPEDLIQYLVDTEKDTEKGRGEEEAAAAGNPPAKKASKKSSEKQLSSWPTDRLPTLEDAQSDPLIAEQEAWAQRRENKIQIATEKNDIDIEEAFAAKVREEEAYRFGVESEAESRRAVYERRTGEVHPVSSNLQASREARARRDREASRVMSQAEHVAQFDHSINGPLGALSHPPLWHPLPSAGSSINECLSLPYSPIRDISIAASRPTEMLHHGPAAPLRTMHPMPLAHPPLPGF